MTGISVGTTFYHSAHGIGVVMGNPHLRKDRKMYWHVRYRSGEEWGYACEETIYKGIERLDCRNCGSMFCRGCVQMDNFTYDSKKRKKKVNKDANIIGTIMAREVMRRND